MAELHFPHLLAILKALPAIEDGIMLIKKRAIQLLCPLIIIKYICFTLSLFTQHGRWKQKHKGSGHDVTIRSEKGLAESFDPRELSIKLEALSDIRADDDDDDDDGDNNTKQEAPYHSMNENDDDDEDDIKELVLSREEELNS